MSRISLIEQLYVKRKSIFDFDYDGLQCPPILSLMNITDIGDLHSIARSLRYNGNMDKKYRLIDEIMIRRGFRKAHCGTNRVVYNFLEIPTFVAKIALDRVGATDSPAEYKNQEFFKPFCCKIFEVDPTGSVAFVERVNPISSREEFISVADDIFNLLITKVIGKYVVDDLGSNTYMNFGIRQLSGGCTFGPVIIDFPYAYELDGAKLMCAREIETAFGKIRCGGEIDYDVGFNYLVCNKCGKKYTALDLKKQDSGIIMFGKDKEEISMSRVKIMVGDTTVVDSGRSSSSYVSNDEFSESYGKTSVGQSYVVGKTVPKKYKPAEQKRREFYTDLQKKHFEDYDNSPVTGNKVVVKCSVDSETANIIKSQVQAEEQQPLKNAVVVSSSVEANMKDIEDKILPEIGQNVTVNVANNDGGIYLSESEMESFSEKFEEALSDSIDQAIADAESTVDDKTSDDTDDNDDGTDEGQDPGEQADYLAEQAAALAEELAQEVSEAIDVPTVEVSDDLIGSDVESEQTDYSDYNPPEETEQQEEVFPEDDPKYKEHVDAYASKTRKKKKSEKKPSARNIKKHSSRYDGYGDDDMSEY